MRRTILLLLSAAFVAAGANPPAPKPFVVTPERFSHQPSPAPAGPVFSWWREFKDPLLDSLIDRAMRANVDIRTAGSRVAEARALRGRSRSTLYPSVDAVVSSTRVRGGFNQGVVHVGNAPGSAQGGNLVSAFETGVVSGDFTMRWELDVFGGLRKEVRAASADQAAAEANLGDVQSIVRSEVARNYIEMRGAIEQAAIVRATVDAEREMLELIRVRADAGLATALDVERQTAQLASVRAVLPDLETQRLQAAHRISVLLGDQPGALLAELERASQQLAQPETPAAVPSDVLKRRPDVRRAESQIAAAYARAGAARAEMYPKFVITGLSGRQSTDLAGITFGAGNFFSVGPGITLPIFNAGRIRMNIAANDARLEQAVHAYEAEVLAAFEETENALVRRENAELKRRDLEAGFQAASRSVDLAQELYLRGLSDFLTVLDAQRQRFQIERELASSRTEALVSTVAVFKAIGN